MCFKNYKFIRRKKEKLAFKTGKLDNLLING